MRGVRVRGASALLRCAAAGLAAIALAACARGGVPETAGAALGAPAVPRAGAEVVVACGGADRRVLAVDPARGKARLVGFPDEADPDVENVFDLAVGRGAAYLLAAPRSDPRATRLVTMPLDGRAPAVARPLPRGARRLAVTCDQRLAIGYGAGSRGPLGRVELRGRDPARPVWVAPLPGEPVALLAARGTLVAVTRARSATAGGGVVSRYAAVRLDAGSGRERARTALPPGSDVGAIGPGGLLHVVHASPVGTLATDGTIGVYDAALSLVRRLRPEVAARWLAVGPGRLVMLLQSPGGGLAVEVAGPRDRRGYGVALDAPLAGAGVVHGDMLVAPLRARSALHRFDLRRGRSRAALSLPGGVAARPALVAAEVTCGEG